MTTERYFQPETQIDESKLQYNPRFDVEAFRTLSILKYTYSKEQYQKELESLLNLTKTNLVTSLAERLNVEIYRTTYRQENGRLYHNDFYPQTPFVEVIKNGQIMRELSGSAETQREEAEIKAFEIVEKELTDENQNKLIAVISPKGKGDSIYGHNFFDVYQKDEGGKITMSRYTSSATYEEFRQAVLKLDTFSNIPENPNDADFISNPIVTYQNIEKIKSTLNQDNKTMAHEDFRQVIQIIKPQLQNYLDDLQKSPTSKKMHKNLKSLQKSADIAAGLDKQFSHQKQREILQQLQISPQETANFLALQPLREVRTGCGISTGATFNPFSVAEFAVTGNLLPKESEDKSDFRCPGKKDGAPCSYIIRYGSGVRKCPKCGEQAKCPV